MKYSDKIMNWLFLGSIGLACIFAIILLVATFAWSEEKVQEMICYPKGVDVASNGNNVPRFMVCSMPGQKGITHMYTRSAEIMPIVPKGTLKYVPEHDLPVEEKS